MGDDTNTKPKTRRSRAELREIMIDAGVEVLASNGVELQISSLSYARVFEHLEQSAGIKVTYGSVHERIWDSLQDYQLSVIERAGTWNSPTSEAWLRSVVAMTSEPDHGATPNAVAGAQEHYARLDREIDEALHEELRGSARDPGARIGDDDVLRAALARLSVAVTEGLALRRMVTGDAEPVVMARTGPGGAVEERDLHALAMWALSRALFPPATPDV